LPSASKLIEFCDAEKSVAVFFEVRRLEGSFLFERCAFARLGMCGSMRRDARDDAYMSD
jgi:hypothetical protein